MSCKMQGNLCRLWSHWNSRDDRFFQNGVQCLFSSCVWYTKPILSAKIEHRSFCRFPGAFASTWHQIQLWFFGFEFSVLLSWKTKTWIYDLWKALVLSSICGIVLVSNIFFCTTSIARRVLFWRFSDPWSSRFQVTSHLLMCLSTASMVSRRHEWHHFFESLWTWIDNVTMSIAADHHLHYSGHNAAR